MIPAIGQVLQCYRAAAQTERMKTGRPSAGTVANALRGAASVCRAAGIDISAPVTEISRRRIDAALSAFMQRGLARISAWSYVCQLPSPDTLRRVKAWYARLEGEHWFAATMMLEFAMRNGDVLRLDDSNFAEKDGRRYLDYVPHKTELSSGRRVFWPIHESIWNRFVDYGGLPGLDVTSETFSDLNRDLRAIGFCGSKASYELRKICIDHVYQKYGAEIAVSLSGDDIRTITRYYADPAQPNIGAVRIIDLL